VIEFTNAQAFLMRLDAEPIEVEALSVVMISAPGQPTIRYPFLDRPTISTSGTISLNEEQAASFFSAVDTPQIYQATLEMNWPDETLGRWKRFTNWLRRRSSGTTLVMGIQSDFVLQHDPDSGKAYYDFTSAPLPKEPLSRTERACIWLMYRVARRFFWFDRQLCRLKFWLG